MSEPDIVFYGMDPPLLERVGVLAAPLALLRTESGYASEVTARVHLDALWMTPMAALELGVAQPPFRVGAADVVAMPPAQRARGLPRYAIVGVALKRGTVLSEEETATLVIRALRHAVRLFNTQATDRIARVGMHPQDLGIRMDTAEAVMRILELNQ